MAALGAAMAGADEAEDLHSRRHAALHAGGGVFDDQTVGGSDAHACGGQGEQVRRGLAVGHLRGAEQMAVKKVQEARKAERMADFSGVPLDATHNAMSARRT